MIDLDLVVTALVHCVHGHMRRIVAPSVDAARDRGAVSLEQVLWFVAAGVSVAVIAAILWTQIKNEANTPVNSPSAP
jgi:hypothetical protein